MKKKEGKHEWAIVENRKKKNTKIKKKPTHFERQ